MLDPLVNDSWLSLHSSTKVTVKTSYTVVLSDDSTESGIVVVILKSKELEGRY